MLVLRIIGLVIAFTISLVAQELEPRAYSPSPTGVNFLVVSYSYQSGDVFADPTALLEDTEARLNAGVIAYGRTFGLAGRSANLFASLPYIWGEVSGEIFEQERIITRSGLADMRLRFAMNILGGPALTPKAFAARKPTTTLGASLMVGAPTGQYDPTKLINIGSNRWSFKPEIGLSHPIGRWFLELYGSIWLFTDNKNFFGGSHRKQKPIGSIQTHIGYTIRPHFWLAADATFYTGGQTVIDDTNKTELLKNSRVGVTFSFPLGRSYSVKISSTRGLATRLGTDGECADQEYRDDGGVPRREQPKAREGNCEPEDEHGKKRCGD